MSNYVKIKKGPIAPTLYVHILVIVRGRRRTGHSKDCLSDRVRFWVFSTHVLVRCFVKLSQSEPAPTSAPMWMDGAFMGVPFSSLPVPGANRGGELKLTFFPLSSASVGFSFLRTFFFFTPHGRPGLTYLPTFRLLPMHSRILPPPPTHPSIYLPTPIYLPSHQPIYLCTYALNLHQGNDDAGR
jgi:hypothetical protein